MENANTSVHRHLMGARAAELDGYVLLQEFKEIPTVTAPTVASICGGTFKREGAGRHLLQRGE